MSEVVIIGPDLAKNVFQAHGMRADGSVAFRTNLSRTKVSSFFAVRPRCVERQPSWPVLTTTLAGGAERKTGMPVWRAAPPA